MEKNNMLVIYFPEHQTYFGGLECLHTKKDDAYRFFYHYVGHVDGAFKFATLYAALGVMSCLPQNYNMKLEEYHG